MGLQKFVAREPYTFANGVVGYRPGGPWDCLGPYAKVLDCPIDGHPGFTRTCYATGHADTFFSVPAACTYRGVTIRGFFMLEDAGIRFVPYTRYSYALDVLRGVYL
jgi:hypothetical protein